MRNDLTDITLVVDRSGSMMSCRADAEGGVNAFIENQQKQEGEALLTLVQFDNRYEFVHKGKPVKDVLPYVLQPRGNTALLDAVGKAVSETGIRLEAMKEEERPGCVVFVIVTDGHENSSVEYTKSQVKELIDKQQSAYNWQFSFLGADAKAFDEAVSMGIRAQAVAAYDPNVKSANAYAVASNNVSRMRSATMRGEETESCFTDEEREELT